MRPAPPLLTLLTAGALASSAATAAEDPAPLRSNRTMKAHPAGHIYYNPATGERVITPWDARPRAASNAVWLNNNTDPCATGGTVGVIDDPDVDGDGNGDLFGGDCETGTFPCEGSWNNFWGDIPSDTVIDCIVALYGTGIEDTDDDHDGIADGIVGLDLYLSFADGDNGFGASGRSCIIEFVVPTLPADVCGKLRCGFAAAYYVTIDLSDTAPSMIFELGDSDGIDQAGTGLSGAAIYGHPTARDLDSDGLHDFSYGFRFDQSSLGTSGERGETKGTIGFVSAAPKLGNPGDLPPHPADATGTFDAVDIYSSGPSCSTGSTNYIGTFAFSGFHNPFSCEDGEEVPYTSAYLELYSPGSDTLCPANLDGSPLPADFIDVIYFLTDFTGPCTDAIGNFDLTGACDFNDVIAFLTSFTSPDCGN